MTISVTISVNGNYKCPVSYRQGDREESQIISGFGRDAPNELHIPFYHGSDVMTLSIGPEEPDNGEQDGIEIGQPGPSPRSGGTGNPPPPPPKPQ